MAVDYADTNWGVYTMEFGSGPMDMTPSIEYEDKELIFKIHSTEKSKAAFKLFKILEHPNPGKEWDITFEARVSVPGLSMDGGKFFGSGETDNNDGPQLFALIYEVGNVTLGVSGVSDRASFYPSSKGKTCHQHAECNYYGPDDYYCVHETHTYQGLSVDGKSFASSGATVVTDEEPFLPGQWATIEMNMEASHCNKTNLTLVIMGIDQFPGYEFTWEIKDVKVSGKKVETIKLADIYDFSAKKHLATPPYCGNKIKDAGEECDGTDGLIDGWTCTSKCVLKEVCGDNKIVGNETCDSEQVHKGYKCSSDCLSETPICGDSYIIEGVEICDGTETPLGFSCIDCISIAPICGDGIIIGDEECDTTNGTSGRLLCSNACELYRNLTIAESSFVSTMFSLADITTEAVPAYQEVVVQGPSLVSVEDIQDQIKIQGLSVSQDFSLCSKGIAVCEERYLISKDLLAANNTLRFPPGRNIGLLKMYTANESYYIGFQTSAAGFFPGTEYTLWLVAGAIVVMLVLLGLALVGVIAVYLYLSAKKKRQRRL